MRRNCTCLLLRLFLGSKRGRWGATFLNPGFPSKDWVRVQDLAAGLGLVFSIGQRTGTGKFWVQWFPLGLDWEFFQSSPVYLGLDWDWGFFSPVQDRLDSEFSSPSPVQDRLDWTERILSPVQDRLDWTQNFPVQSKTDWTGYFFRLVQSRGIQEKEKKHEDLIFISIFISVKFNGCSVLSCFMFFG